MNAIIVACSVKNISRSSSGGGDSSSSNQRCARYLLFYIQEEILVAASDRISIVHLIHFDSLVERHHHVISHDIEREVRAVQVAYILDRLVTGRNIP